MRISRLGIIFFLTIVFSGCDENDEITPTEELTRVGFELLEIKSFTEIVVWINDESMTQEEFDTLGSCF